MKTVLLSLLLVLAGTPVAAAAVDHSLFGGLLAKYVRDGRVDYAGFKTEEAVLDRYLDLLAAVNPDELPRDEAFAFYVNAYNAWTIKLILGKYPDLTSIKDLGNIFQSPWKKKIARIGGETVTLDHIEHDILRPRFQDPRVHFAINCAALSCPPLQPEPFRGESLDAQLDSATRAFLNDPSQTYLGGNTLHVSKIFDWFAEDFNRDPVSFVFRYAEGELKKQMEAVGKGLRVTYLPYDWSLNKL